MTSAALTAPQTAPRPRIGAWLAANAPAMLALVVFAATLWPTALLNDSDTWWHLSAGDWIIAHHAVPHADPFSWTFAGKPWIAHEWLSEILMSGAFALAGWPGLMLLTALAAAPTVFVLAREAARHMTGLALGLLVLAGAALFGPHLLARPHLLVAPVVALWLAALARHDGTPPWRFLPLMTLWANMHGSFIAGIALSLPFALEATLGAPDRWRTAGVWAGFTAATIAAAALTPFGIDGLLFPLKLMIMPGVNGISEWSPIDLAKPQPIVIAVIAFACVWSMRRPSLSVVRRLVLVGLLAASLHQQRHEMLLGLMGIVLLAPPLGRALGQSPAPPRLSTQRLSQLAPVAAVLLAALRLATPLTDPVNAHDPAAALAHAPRQGRVFNDYTFGGYLIRAGFAPFIDSRADMYGPGFLDRYSDAIGSAPALKAELDRDGATWTMLKPGSPAAAVMDRMPGWRRTYADAVAVIHVRAPLVH